MWGDRDVGPVIGWPASGIGDGDFWRGLEGDECWELL